MSEMLLPKIGPAIEHFQNRSARLGISCLSILPPIEKAPQAVICLEHDPPQKYSNHFLYHLNVEQLIDIKHSPVVNIDFTTDYAGNLFQLDKLHFWIGEYILEYNRDQVMGQRAYLAKIRKNVNKHYEEVDKITYPQLIRQLSPTNPLNSLDWTDIVFTYITETVYKNGKPTEKTVDSEVVAKRPLISYFQS